MLPSKKPDTSRPDRVELHAKSREVKLAEMIVRLVERNGYSRNRRKVAEAVGVSPAALSQYVHEQAVPSLRTLTALATFFNVSLDYLVYGEATTQAVDYGPLARYVDHALAGVQARASQHSSLVAQVGQLLGERIDEVARTLAVENGGSPAGFMSNDDLLKLEGYSLHTSLISTDLQFDLIAIEGADDASGRFLPTVAANLGRDRSYEFLLPGSAEERSPLVQRLRMALSTLVGGDKVHRHCSIRRATQPTANGIVIYRLDTATLAAEQPAMHLRIASYLDELGHLGYVIAPNGDSHGDLLMDAGHARNGREPFQRLWASSQPL